MASLGLGEHLGGNIDANERAGPAAKCHAAQPGAAAKIEDVEGRCERRRAKKDSQQFGTTIAAPLRRCSNSAADASYIPATWPAGMRVIVEEPLSTSARNRRPLIRRVQQASLLVARRLGIFAERVIIEVPECDDARASGGSWASRSCSRLPSLPTCGSFHAHRKIVPGLGVIWPDA